MPEKAAVMKGAVPEAIGGLEAKPPATGGWGFGSKVPASKMMHFAKLNYLYKLSLF